MAIGISIETVIALAVAAGSGGLAGRALRGTGRSPPSPTDSLPSTRDAADADRVGVPTAQKRILRHLRANGGQLRQQQLVEARDWSAATVSRHLSEMEAEGTVERYRRGREKVVYLPESAPAVEESEARRERGLRT